jgi:hypothetical protein
LIYPKCPQWKWRLKQQMIYVQSNITSENWMNSILPALVRKRSVRVCSYCVNSLAEWPFVTSGKNLNFQITLGCAMFFICCVFFSFVKLYYSSKFAINTSKTCYKPVISMLFICSVDVVIVMIGLSTLLIFMFHFREFL